jgi:phosphoribosylamine---glycine ligase
LEVLEGFMKVLVIGSGGREHALAWKIAQSPEVEQVFIAPGNAGTSEVGLNVDIGVDDQEGLLRFARDNQIGLTVVGPEAPLVAGIVDRFESEGLSIFGPSSQAAQLEGSKDFAKSFMTEFNIPTARSETFNMLEPALTYIEQHRAPLVIKADGLAAGKGVTVAKDLETARRALKECFEERIFGEAGSRVVIEDFLEGEEVSVLAICDGTRFLALPSSQDHKRLLDGDEGPNTGGMGAYCPAPVLTPDLQQFVDSKVLHPTLEGMAQRGTPYKGVLYAGMILTSDGPKVLEFNCRMGDPETQAVLPVVRNDLLRVFLDASAGRLEATADIEVDPRPAVCVVMASGGYPGSYPKGLPISGLAHTKSCSDSVVFHAGTRTGEDGSVLTAGGRVLGVVGRGKDIAHAIRTAYDSVSKIGFEGVQFRRDIGKRAITSSLR